ncbi:MAG: DUF4912 domain-containing protein [Leptospira sp.]|nr:DUF4912 domain-containing protein [Leptospira sp.]
MAPKKKKTTVKKTVQKGVLPAKKKSAPKKKVPSKKSGAAPKKKIAAKTASAKVSSERKFSIYTDSKVQKPLHSPGKDMIKVLIRNPYEAYIFWNIMPETYKKAIDFFQKASSEMQLELRLEYSVNGGDKHVRNISLHPLSQNYFCRFLGPVYNLKAYLLVVNEGRSFTLFDSSSVSLPEDKPVDYWDEHWVNPEWIAQGFLVRGRDGKFYLSNSIPKTELESILESKPFGSSDLSGSSGFMGSSGKGGSSR